MGCASANQFCVLHNSQLGALPQACLFGQIATTPELSAVATEHANDEDNRLVTNQSVRTIVLKLHLSTTHVRGVLAAHQLVKHISL